MLGIRIARLKRALEREGFMLRKYRLTDLPEMLELFNRAGNEPGPTGDRRAHRGLPSFNGMLHLCRWLRRTFRIGYLMEVAEGGTWRIAGFAGLYDLELGKSVWVSLLVFREEDRRRGLGHATLDLLTTALARGNVAGTLRVRIEHGNTGSLRFCEKYGFKLSRRDESASVLELDLHG